MTNRRTPAQRQTSAAWKPGRDRAELVKAIGGAAAVVAGTALIIFLIKPGDDSTGSVPTPTPNVTAPVSSTPPDSSTGAPGTTAPTGSTPTTPSTQPSTTTGPPTSTTGP